MTARSLAVALWRRRWLALIVLCVELAAVVLWVAASPRRYTATATITAAPSAQLLSSTGNFSDLESTLAQIANSRSVLADVRDRIGGVRSVGQLRGEVSGARVSGTVLIRIKVVDKSAPIAAKIANATAAVLPLHDPSGGSFVFTQTDRAATPGGASSPDVTLILLVGAVLGVFLAVVAALARDRTARTVETAGQLRASAGTDVLATVPRPADFDAVADGERDDPVGAALRSLRVELDYASSEHPTGAIVIADAAAADAQAGWLAANLASALAQVDHRVLVIDGDFHNAHRHPALVFPDSLGLYGVLQGDSSVEHAVRPGPRPGVMILPAGSAASRSTASLIELRFQQVLADVSEWFDVVLVVAPPASASDDARVMAIGGSLLLVVGARKVREARLRELIGDLRATRTRVLGAVLVGSRARVLI